MIHRAIFILATILVPSLVLAQVVFPNRGGTGTSTVPQPGYVLVGTANGTYAPQATSTLGFGSGGGSGTVTSVGLIAPTGFTVSGSPVTTSGSLELLFAGGYSPLLTASSTAWQSFYTTPSSRITAGTGLDWSSNTLDASLGDFSTTNLAEGTNLYYLDSRARTALSETILGITYTSGTGVFSLDSGYTIPSTTRASNWDTAYSWGNHASQGYITDGNTNWDNSYGFITDGNTGWDNSYGFVAQGQTVGTTTAGVAGQASYWTGIRTLGTVATGTLTENALGLEFDNSTRGLFGGSATLSLTSGYAIPSTTRMSTWDAKGSGTVTSVGMSVPTGFSITGSPVTSAGTLAVTYTAGYFLPTTTRAATWDLAHSWGNHATQGYLTGITGQSIEDLSDVTSFTQAGQDLFYYNGSAWDRLAKGANGEVLLTNASGNLDWVATSTLGLGGAGGGTVTSVDMTVPTGLTVSGNPVTTSGTLAVALGAGYNIPLTASTTNWNTAYNWGNHASQGYITDGNTGWDNTYGLITATNATATITTATTTNLAIPTSLSLFGGAKVTTANALCIQLTGSSALCDGTDAAGAGGIGTSSIPVAGNLAYWTSASALSDVATGTLSESVAGLELSASRGLIGGSAALSLSSGYLIPTTTVMGQWNTAYSWGNHATAGYDQVTTAGDGLTRTANDFDCDTASGSVFGCLTSTDWNTFNGKESVLTFSGGLTRTTNNIAPTSGYNIPLTASTTNWNTAFDWGNHASQGYLTGNQSITLSGDASGSGATAITVTVADDSHAHTGTTLSGIDISSDTNLSADGTEIILTGDALSLGTALTFTTGTSTTSFFSGLGTFTNMVVNTLATFLNVVVTGLLDVGGGVLEIPNGTAPTADDPGELAHDTDGHQLILDDKVVGSAVQRIWGVTVGSTSPAFISGGLLSAPTNIDGYTITRIQCHVVGGTSKVIAVEDASANSSEDITCATTNTTDDGSITNATYTASELSFIDFGATTGAVDTVTISVFGEITRE